MQVKSHFGALSSQILRALKLPYNSDKIILFDAIQQIS